MIRGVFPFSHCIPQARREYMTKPTKWVVDTNVLLHNAESIEGYDIVLLSHVLIELDNHKSSHRGDLAYSARKATRYIKNNRDKFTFDLNEYDGSELGEGYTNQYQDDNILLACVTENTSKERYGLITGDVLLQLKAESLGIEAIDPEENIEIESDYKGYKEVEMTEDELKHVYENLDLNQWDLLENEYLLVADCFVDEIIDGFRWDGSALHKIHSKGFRTQQFGQFKPKDFYQKATVDSILNNTVTMITGKAGSGKSKIAIETAWHLIERGKFDRLVVFTNPVKTRNAEALGFYKGTRTEKLLDSQIGIMLSSKFGDKYALESEIVQGRLELLPFSDIRGYETTGEKKTIVLIAEAQNTNIDLMKLGLERIGDNTKVIIDGDPNTQVDMDTYRVANGMTRASEVFRGNELYGEVELKHIYRSPVAELASKM